MIIKNLTKNFYINLFIIFSIFIIDRITKIYVVSVNGKNSYEDLYSSKFLNIHLIWNEGIAFGLFSFHQNNLYNLLTLIISIIVIVILKMIINSYGIKKYGLMMIFGSSGIVMCPYLPEVFVHFPPPSHPDFVSLPGFEPSLQDPGNIKNSDRDFLSISHISSYHHTLHTSIASH